MILAVFLSLSAVCASDINQTDDTITASSDDNAVTVNSNDNVETATYDNNSVANGEDDAVDELSSADSENLITATAKINKRQVYIKNDKFPIYILDENNTGIANKTVQVKFNDKTTNLTTDANGKVKLKLKSKGNYVLTYSFNEQGYTPIAGSKKVTVVANNETKITASKYKAYIGVKNTYVINLTVGGVKFPYQKILFKINGKSYTVKTDLNGQAKLDINLPVGTYKIRYYYNGTKNAIPLKGSSKIIVIKGMPTKVVKWNSPTFVENVKTPMKFKYFDARGNPIKKQTLVLKVNGKKYKKVTDENGYVKFKMKFAKGSYKVKVYSYSTKVYKLSGIHYTIKVKADESRNNYGLWSFGADMGSINLKTMANNGVKHILLNYFAVELHGKKAVENFIAQANSLDIKVHIWMQAFYNGGWISPVDSEGKFKYSLFDSITKQAKEYASLKGVAGIHFDYLRFGGTAYKHKNGVEAINYFTKQVCEALHKQNSKLIVSAAVMPEPSSMVYYYGQDIPTISKYLDVIIPMVYKGNYNQGRQWIKSTTQEFVKMSNGAQIWTGLQTYGSDEDVSRLSASELKNDSQAALDGGATGVIMFRMGLFNLFDFNTLR